MEQTPKAEANTVKSPPPPVIEAPETSAPDRAKKSVEAAFPRLPHAKAVQTNTLNLPSGGVAVIRAAGAAEEDLLSSMKLQEKDEALDQWLAGCVVSLNGVKNGGPDDEAFPGLILNLLPGDRRYIAVEITKLTYGEKIDCPVDCPHCGEVNELTVNVDAILASSKPYPAVLTFEVLLPSGKKAVCGYNTGVHRKALQSLGEDAMSLLAGLKMRLRSIDGVASTSKSWAELDGPDRAALRKAILAHPDCGPDTTVRNVCRNKRCGKPFMTPLEMHLSFFLPGLRLS